MKNWGLKFLVAVMMTGVGYKSQTLWLSICATIWAGYLISYFTSPLLIAYSQNTRVAKTAKLTVSVLGTLAAAALLSAPIVLYLWYRVTYPSSP